MSVINCGKPYSQLSTESEFVEFESHYLSKWKSKCYYVSNFHPQPTHTVYTNVTALQAVGDKCDTIIIHNPCDESGCKIYMFLNSIIFTVEFSK